MSKATAVAPARNGLQLMARRVLRLGKSVAQEDRRPRDGRHRVKGEAVDRQSSILKFSGAQRLSPFLLRAEFIGVELLKVRLSGVGGQTTVGNQIRPGDETGVLRSKKGDHAG